MFRISAFPVRGLPESSVPAPRPHTNPTVQGSRAASPQNPYGRSKSFPTSRIADHPLRVFRRDWSPIARHQAGLDSMAMLSLTPGHPGLRCWPGGCSENESKIVKTALNAKGPYVMAVNPTYGLRRARLAYPLDLPRPAGATVMRAECTANAPRPRP